MATFSSRLALGPGNARESKLTKIDFHHEKKYGNIAKAFQMLKFPFIHLKENTFSLTLDHVKTTEFIRNGI